MNSTAIGLIIDGLFGPILKFGFHYTVAGFDIYAGEMLFAMAVLVLFGLFNIQGVKVAGSIQTLLAFLLGSSVLTLTAIALTSDAATFANMEPLWGFDKETAVSALRAGSYDGIEPFVHTGTVSICAAVLATLAIAPWAYVGFDTIPQAAEEYKFSPTKVSFIMIVAISFGCFVYIANNTITAAALANWPDLIINSSHTPWLLLAASERLLGVFGKVIVGIAVFSAVLTGIMGFYMASSRLMYSMARDGYLPESFAVIDPKHRTPKNALLFCIGISLSGPILGREALGWFVDMCAIGASIGFLFTCLATRVTMKKNGESNSFLSIVSVLGAAFSAFFIALQLIPIPGLDFVHFGTPSYLLLVVWILIGAAFYLGRFGLKVR